MGGWPRDGLAAPLRVRPKPAGARGDSNAQRAPPALVWMAEVGERVRHQWAGLPSEPLTFGPGADAGGTSVYVENESGVREQRTARLEVGNRRGDLAAYERHR